MNRVNPICCTNVASAKSNQECGQKPLQRKGQPLQRQPRQAKAPRPLLLNPGERVHLVLPDYKVESWNVVMRMHPGQLHKHTQTAQRAMLSALRASASGCSMMTTCAKSRLSIACDTLDSYLMTGRAKRASSRAKCNARRGKSGRKCS
jgi:hypothetical protein